VPLSKLGHKPIRVTLTYLSALTAAGDPSARYRLVLKKRFNELAKTVEKNDKHNEEQHKENKERHERTNKKLDWLLKAIIDLAKRSTGPLAPVSDDSSGTPAPTTIAPTLKLVFKNPPLTPEITELVEQVVKTKLSRAEEKKQKPPTQEENSIKVSAKR
jgi:hypothetical protein